VRTITAPQAIELDSARPTVFLAGSIDQGDAIDWQAKAIEWLKDESITILNPRRESWNPSWPQDVSFTPFAEQVEWELEGLEKADHILLYLAKASQAPVSLLELGLFLRSDKLIVACDRDYWRRGNVVISCQKYNTPCYPDLEAGLTALRQKL
jgi:hypothetical protein